MLERILEAFSHCSYGFSLSAHENNPLSHQYEQWRSHYQMKWSVAHVLQPKNILEIGVGKGDSAKAFLNASSDANYLGIELEGPESSGEAGVLEEIRNSLKQYSADIIAADPKALSSFPGQQYDLIHINCQNNVDALYRFMQKAIKQASYVLVEGVLSTHESAQSNITFIKDYKELIDWSVIIPGYLSQTLIKVNKTLQLKSVVESSGDIQSLYGSDYYLTDCGGFETYHESGGKKLTDSRLNSVFMLADVKPGDHVLDAGCGRGEMAFAAAKSGATVHAVDYSSSAIELASQVFKGEEKLATSVIFECADVTRLDSTKPYTKIIASDLIEHLMPNELELMYKNFSAQLAPEGEFVLHTFPNLWFYQYGYERFRRRVRKAGGYFSPEPRSHYERLMHINEQSPRVLKKQLEMYFKHVLVWFGDEKGQLGNLERSFGLSDFMNARDLYAIASNHPVDINEIKGRLEQKVLSAEERVKVSLSCDTSLRQIRNSDFFELSVSVHNNTSGRIAGIGRYPIRLSYHWLSEAGSMVEFEGQRTALPVIHPGCSESVKVNVKAPEKRGAYVLEILALQEGVAWFDTNRAGIIRIPTQID